MLKDVERVTFDELLQEKSKESEIDRPLLNATQKDDHDHFHA